MSASAPQSTSSTGVHDNRRLPALTGSRFIAALAVLISHLAERGLTPVPSPVIQFLDGGRTAVSFFFVLSGFVLTYNYVHLSGRYDQLHFYANRFSRIYPIVILSLGAAAIGMTYALANPNSGALLDWYSLKKPSWFNIGGSLVAQLTMLTGWLPTASLNQPWNGPAWSISCEIFFYALFPYVIGRIRNFGRRGLATVILSGFILQLSIIGVSRAYAPSGQRGFLVSQFPPTHLFEFVIGIVAAVTYLRGGRAWLDKRTHRLFLLLPTVSCLVAIAVCRPVDPAYLLMSPLFGLLVFCLAAAPRARHGVLSHPGFVLLGEASFSLYMIHIPLINLLSMAALGPIANWLAGVAFILLSMIIYKYFEVPVRKRVRKALARRVDRAGTVRVR